MIVRRVVTGRAADGSSRIRSDGEPPRLIGLTSMPGFRGALVWSSDGPPSGTQEASDTTADEKDFVPPPGGTRLHLMHFPPDSSFAAPGLDLAAVGAEQRAQMPGLAERFEPDGMHSTPTLDYAIVVSGEVWLELDDGSQARLTAGDIVVQQGTRHAWRNRSEETVTMAFVMVGATS
jgi:hypothetical protein